MFETFEDYDGCVAYLDGVRYEVVEGIGAQYFINLDNCYGDLHESSVYRFIKKCKNGCAQMVLIKNNLTLRAVVSAFNDSCEIEALSVGLGEFNVSSPARIVARSGKVFTSSTDHRTTEEVYAQMAEGLH